MFGKRGLSTGFWLPAVAKRVQAFALQKKGGLSMILVVCSYKQCACFLSQQRGFPALGRQALSAQLLLEVFFAGLFLLLERFLASVALGTGGLSTLERVASVHWNGWPQYIGTGGLSTLEEYWVASVHWNGWPQYIGTGGLSTLERVASVHWNGWPQYIGTGGLSILERVASVHWNGTVHWNGWPQ